MKQDHLFVEDATCSSPEMIPYMRLWASVMRLGIQDYCTARARKEPAGDHRVFWFESDDYAPGSFTWLCELFGLDPDKARTQVLLNWRTNVLKGELADG